MAEHISIRDRDIISKSFRMLTGGRKVNDTLERFEWKRYFNVFSSATGDHRFINPLPQFSPSTDPRGERYLRTKMGGMGSIYKDVYDENSTNLVLVPGVEQFSGLLSFVTNMFDAESSIMATKGRMPRATFYLGQAMGAVTFWPMQLLSIGFSFLSFLTNTPKNSFYTVKAAMGSYVGVAQGILNDIMINEGMVEMVLQPNIQESNDRNGMNMGDLFNTKKGDNKTTLSRMKNALPELINDDGSVDLLRLVNRGARKNHYLMRSLSRMDDRNKNGAPFKDGQDRADAVMRDMESSVKGMPHDIEMGRNTTEYINKYQRTVGRVRSADEGNYPELDSSYTDQTANYLVNGGENGGGGIMSAAGSTGADGVKAPSVAEHTQQKIEQISGMNTSAGTSTPTARKLDKGEDYQENMNDNWGGDILDMLDYGFTNALECLSFRVEASSSPISDSFSNSHTQSAMASKFNSVVKQANDFRFDVAGGATGIDVVDGIFSMLSDGLKGVLSGTVVGNIPLALMSNTHIKIPDHWDGSTTSLHKESYVIESRCNYAHPYERLMKIWVPFSLLLPLVAPKSVGGSAMTSPFLVKAYCKSRSIIRTGMVESMRFTFGEGEAGWTKDRKPLNIRIEFDIVDLDPIVSIPINRRMDLVGLTNPAMAVNRLLFDDVQYNDYISRLSGLDYLDTVLRYTNLNRKLTQARTGLEYSMSSSNFAGLLNQSIIGDIGSMLTKQMHR